MAAIVSVDAPNRDTVDTMELPVDLTTNAYKYFGRTNFVNKNVLSEERVLQKHLEEQWDTIPQESKNALLDLLFVDEEVRTKYSTDNNVPSAIYGSSHEKSTKNKDTTIEESFPRLLINSGQKINVDFDNELWTWRDEHSGPFSWMSRSQQDLTLDDLEPDNILKPQPKQLRVDLEDESSRKEAKTQFTFPCNSWCHDVIEDFRKHQAEIALTPSPSLDFKANVKAGRSAEEVNPGFEGSLEDLSAQTSRENSAEKEEIGESTNKKSLKKDQGRKSPSPKKGILGGGSLKKSPMKKSDREKEDKLIMKGEESFVAEAYCNPAMESEWSHFVGDDATLPVTDAPGVQVMDRGEERPDSISTASPCKGDQVQLIPDTELEESPAQPRPNLPYTITPEYSDWSAESTPDHKTHLLKGLRSPVHGTQRTNVSAPTSEEILTVAAEGNDYVVTSEQVEKRESKIPSTGFDFLDNW